MKTHARAVTIGMAAAAVLAATLTAGPAMAASVHGSTVTKQTCIGTFTIENGLRICTSPTSTYVREGDIVTKEIFSADQTLVLAYEAKGIETVGVTTVLSQKARQPIDIVTTEQVLSTAPQNLLETQKCFSIDGSGQRTFVPDIGVCLAAGISIP